MDLKRQTNSLEYQDTGKQVPLITRGTPEHDAWQRYGAAPPTFLTNCERIDPKDFVLINGKKYPHGIITLNERKHYINVLGESESYFCTFCKIFTPTPQCYDCKHTHDIESDYFCGICKLHISQRSDPWEHYSSNYHYHHLAIYNPTEETRFFQEEYIEPKRKTTYYLSPSLATASALYIRDEPPEDLLYVKLEYPVASERYHITQLKAERNFQTYAKLWAKAIHTGEYGIIENSNSIMNRKWYVKSALNQHLFSLESTPLIPCGGESALIRGLIKQYAVTHFTDRENYNPNNYGYQVSDIPCHIVKERYASHCPQKHYRLKYNNVDAIKEAIIEMTGRIGPVNI